MARRDRDRRGRHESVGGAAADGALTDLVAQFADPWAFVRELVQNSLDAGALSIDIVVSHEGDVVTIAVIDDGEGMDRATIEGYLLTLFRSTKEQDLTKIGKFGIGFVSLFAVEPFEVVVDTGRDGVWHRVVFDAAREYTLYKQAEPFEGTTVTLKLRGNKARAVEAASKARESAVRWCRYADADIRVGGPTGPPTSIRAPFTVVSPVTVTFSEDAVEAVLGISAAARPPVAFLNHGLTLWQGDSDVVPGVTFLVKGRHLEHTLTRDDVIRDRHFHHVVDRLRHAAGTRLRAAVLAALDAAAKASDLDAAARIAEALTPAMARGWMPDRVFLPGVGRPVTFGGLFRHGGDRLGRLLGTAPQTLWVGDPSDPLAQALASTHPIVAATRATQAHARFAAQVLDLKLTWVAERFTLATPAPIDPALTARFEAANRVSAALGSRFSVVPATLVPAGRLALRRPKPHGVCPIGKGGDYLCVDPATPLVRKLARVPVQAAGVLLLRAALAGAGVGQSPVDALVELGRDP